MTYTILVTLMTTTVNSPVFICLHLEMQNTQKYHILYGKFVLDVHLGITFISQTYIVKYEGTSKSFRPFLSVGY